MIPEAQLVVDQLIEQIYLKGLLPKTKSSVNRLVFAILEARDDFQSSIFNEFGFDDDDYAIHIKCADYGRMFSTLN